MKTRIINKLSEITITSCMYQSAIPIIVKAHHKTLKLQSEVTPSTSHTHPCLVNHINYANQFSFCGAVCN